MRRRPLWNMSLDLRGHSPIDGEPPSPAHGRRRRSALSIASGLKPSRERLQRLWPGSKSANAKDYDVNNLGTVVCLADVQMGALDCREPRALGRQNESRSDAWIDEDQPETTTIGPSPTRSPPPPPAKRRPCSPSPSPWPLSPPPYPPPYPPPSLAPPSVPELSPARRTEFFGQDDRLPTLPTVAYRRRAKKPIRTIGQLEPGEVSRTSSVSTIARQYRELVEYPNDETGHEPVSRNGRRPSRRGRYGSRRRSRLASSLVSDNLVGGEDERVLKLVSLATPPATPPLAQRKDEEESSPKLHTGFELLRRELASGLESRFSGVSQDASVLQVLVMIEAYERLRDQISAMEPENTEVKKAIDSWLEALHAVQGKLAGEAAMSESEYEE
ncbi:hypothetical protein CDD80_1060 [Ophiocordyceps camponoti-rufipedis]|uniref:Mating-type switching protein swi10 n=1 Tax=Ophiocordyceps camponoti-rufipedis TaxID=2004952 RepID=A0A2C5YR17_9HYPO|nr:hypothetical protein CDD80_1060 [Ophiocordyceps camponoti-rufipedis]